MKKLAIIGAGYISKIIAERAKELGVETHCFAWEQGAIAKDYVDHFYPISIFEKEEILKICQANHIDGVIATTELTVAIAAYISEKMGLIGNPYDVSKQITDKSRNRECIKEVKEFAQIGTWTVSTLEEIEEIENINYPIILKPVQAGGKRGIIVVNNPDELKEAFEYTKNSLRSIEIQKIIVEEFIAEGMEFSVESLSYKGNHTIIQVTEKISSGAPHCTELGHQQPANINQELREQIELAVKAGLEAIGLENGCCHTEIKANSNGIYLIEFNARPGGGHISYPLTELSTGYPYITGIIEIALDEFNGVEKEQLKTNYAGVYFVIDESKELKGLFDVCQNYEWCYLKNNVTDDIDYLTKNDGYNTNYFIYYTEDKRPDFDELMNEIK